MGWFVDSAWLGCVARRVGSESGELRNSHHRIVALISLLLTLAVTPLARLFGGQQLIPFRRLLGFVRVHICGDSFLDLCDLRP